MLTFGSNLWSMILSKKDQPIPLPMLFNGLPTISVNFPFIQATEKFKLMTLTVKMTLKKSLSTSLNSKERNFKVKPEAEWASQKKFLVPLTKRKLLNSKLFQSPIKLNFSSKVLSDTPYFSKMSTIKMNKS